VADDFQLTASMALLKLVLEMHENGHVTSTTDFDRQDDLEAINGNVENSDLMLEPNDGDHAMLCDATDQPQLTAVVAPIEVRETLEDLQNDGAVADDVDEKHDAGEEELSQCAADIADDGDDTQDLLLTYEQKPKGKSATASNSSVESKPWSIRPRRAGARWCVTRV
jgi:hypothetical protein